MRNEHTYHTQYRAQQSRFPWRRFVGGGGATEREKSAGQGVRIPILICFMTMLCYESFISIPFLLCEHLFSCRRHRFRRFLCKRTHFQLFTTIYWWKSTQSWMKYGQIKAELSVVTRNNYRENFIFLRLVVIWTQHGGTCQTQPTGLIYNLVYMSEFLRLRTFHSFVLDLQDALFCSIPRPLTHNHLKHHLIQPSQHFNRACRSIFDLVAVCMWLLRTVLHGIAFTSNDRLMTKSSERARTNQIPSNQCYWLNLICAM